MKRKLSKAQRQVTEEMMVDSGRLRMALMMACLQITNGNMWEAMGLADELYDEAPKLMKLLSASGFDLETLPGGPAQILPFTKPNQDSSDSST